MNLSGWMSIIPIFNPLVLIFGSGQSGDNDYGPNPKRIKLNTCYLTINN